MEVYSVICERNWSEGNETFIIDRYSSEEEAKKHLDWLFEKRSIDITYKNVKKREDGSFTCSYELFKYANTETYYVDWEDIDIKDSFVEY